MWLAPMLCDRLIHIADEFVPLLVYSLTSPEVGVDRPGEQVQEDGEVHSAQTVLLEDSAQRKRHK